MADRGIRVLYGLGTVFLLVNIATPETFGLYSLQLAVFSSLSVLANFGLEQISTKYFVEKSYSVGDVFLARFLTATPVALLHYYGARLFFDETEIAITIALSVAIVLNYNVLIFNYYNAHRKLQNQLKNTLIMILFSGGIKLIALYTRDIHLFFASIALDGAVPLALFVALEKVKAALPMVLLIFRERRRELFILFLSTLIVQLNARADFLVLYSVARDLIELSQYSLALKLAEVFAVAASILLTSITPVLFSCRDITKTSSLFRSHLLKLFTLLVVALFTLYFIAPFLLGAGMDDLYKESVPLAMWLVSAYFFGALAAFISIWYINIGAPLLRLSRALLLLIITGVTTYILATQYGAYGAAVAVFGSNFVVGVVMVILRKDTLLIVFGYRS
jgi:O-antigen/teichoic acid export membrane protein